MRSFSDILSEVDGSPSRRFPIVDANLFLNTNHETVQRLSRGNHGFQGNEAVSEPYEMFQRRHQSRIHDFQRIIWLRATLNAILQGLYTTSQAYCRPEEVESVIIKFRSKLDLWLQSLPPGYHRFRDAHLFDSIPAHSDPLQVRF
jgi:hypothetical protein